MANMKIPCGGFYLDKESFEVKEVDGKKTLVGKGGGVQSDWNQNDEKAPDYVKNRPFYGEKDATLIDNQVLTFLDTGGTGTGGWADETQVLFPCYNNDFVVVNWDGEIYKCNKQSINLEGQTLLFFGNGSLIPLGLNIMFENTKEPFAIVFIPSFDSITSALISKDIGNHTVSVTGYNYQIPAHLMENIPVKYDTENVTIVNNKGFHFSLDSGVTDKVHYVDNSGINGDFYRMKYVNKVIVGWYNSDAPLVLNKEPYKGEWAYGRDTFVFGNKHILEDNLPDTGEPVVFLYDPVGDWFNIVTSEQDEGVKQMTVVCLGIMPNEVAGSSFNNTCYATGVNSLAEGQNTIASSRNQHVQGKHNIADFDNKYAHIVGNGYSAGHESNAHTLDWNGNSWYKGNVLVGGNGDDTAKAELTPTALILGSVDGTKKYKITVDNTGVIKAEEVV